MSDNSQYRGGRFYQYRSDVLGRDLETLLERNVWCGKLSQQNDPFELAALDALSADTNQQEKYLNAGVACFCRSITNPLLWSHYANSHKGFVVGYNKEHPWFVGEPHEGNVLFDVKYEDALPTLEHFPNIDEFRLEAMRTKPTCWAYEQEVRLFWTPGNQKFAMPEESIKELIFGVRMPPDRREEIISKVGKSGLNLRYGAMEYLPKGMGYGVRLKWMT